MQDLFSQVEEAKQYILSQTKQTEFEVGIILGTGLGRLAEELQVKVRIPYDSIPYFIHSTVEFHQGEILIGTLANQKIIMMNGRFHLYEGYTVQQITFPVRVMKALGIESLVISNACGTVNSDFKAGDILLVRDHINLLGQNPLIGVTDHRFGLRFPDMSRAYYPEYLKQMKEIAVKQKIALKEGVYAAMTGPCLETAAEYRMLQIIGADAIGMSTVPEVIVAAQANLKVLTLGIITDECFPETLEVADISKIIATAKVTEPNLTLLIKSFLQQL